jgi:hypothetical protein
MQGFFTSILSKLAARLQPKRRILVLPQRLYHLRQSQR